VKNNFFFFLFEFEQKDLDFDDYPVGFRYNGFVGEVKSDDDSKFF
jgi:hypothetical protein